MRLTDLKLLAEVYGTTADRLLFDPGDNLTPALMRRAHAVLVTKDRNAIAARPGRRVFAGREKECLNTGVISEIRLTEFSDIR